MLQLSYTYVPSVCSKRFICFQTCVAANVTCCKCSMSRREKWAQVVPLGAAAPACAWKAKQVWQPPRACAAAGHAFCSSRKASPAGAAAAVWGQAQQHCAGRRGQEVHHTQAFQVLSSHMGIMSCRSMLCLTVLDPTCIIVMCVSHYTRRVWCYRLGVGSRRGRPDVASHPYIWALATPFVFLDIVSFYSLHCPFHVIRHFSFLRCIGFLCI
jgi:hypothetical protein